MSTPAVYDLNAALEAVEGDRELLRHMVEAFVLQSPTLSAEITQAIADSDAGMLQRAAHTIRGAVANFAADAANEAAKRLEDIGRTGDLRNASNAQVALEHALFELQNELLQFSKGNARRILIADDEHTTRVKLQALLTKYGYEVVVARDGLEAWDILQREDCPPLALLDWIMPGLDGAELCRRVRKAGRRSYVYIVMLTVRNEMRDLVESMEAGADDYIAKPFDIDELRVRLRVGERIVRLQEELRLQATHDHLTGILNRGTILEVLQRELSHVRRSAAPLSIILADLDEFKSVNDTHGHAIGDAVLREAANRLRGRLRPYDSLGRYGGEEFLIVLPGCTVSAAMQVAERARSAVADSPVQTRAGMIPLTVSLGVATISARTTESEALVLLADEALYRAKHAGRNRVEGPPTV